MNTWKKESSLKLKNEIKITKSIINSNQGVTKESAENALKNLENVLASLT